MRGDKTDQVVKDLIAARMTNPDATRSTAPKILNIDQRSAEKAWKKLQTKWRPRFRGGNWAPITPSGAQQTGSGGNL